MLLLIRNCGFCGSIKIYGRCLFMYIGFELEENFLIKSSKVLIITLNGI